MTEFVREFTNHSQAARSRLRTRWRCCIEVERSQDVSLGPGHRPTFYMANCDISGPGYPIRPRNFLRSSDAKYEYQKEEKRSNGKVDEAGFSERNFMRGTAALWRRRGGRQGIMRFPARTQIQGWINIDHQYSRVSREHSFERCLKYLREKTGPDLIRTRPHDKLTRGLLADRAERTSTTRPLRASGAEQRRKPKGALGDSASSEGS